MTRTRTRLGGPPQPLELVPDESALLIIDMTRDFIAPGAPMECPAGRQLASRLRPLIERCRETHLQVIYVNHVHEPSSHDMGTLARRFPAIGEGRALRAGSEGVAVWEEIAPGEDDIVVTKIRQSGFAYTSLEAVLREIGATTLIFSGVATGACVESTARDAVARDFDAILLSDGTAGSNLQDHGFGDFDSALLQRVILTNFAQHFGQVHSVGDVLAALAHAS